MTWIEKKSKKPRDAILDDGVSRLFTLIIMLSVWYRQSRYISTSPRPRPPLPPQGQQLLLGPVKSGDVIVDIVPPPSPRLRLRPP